MDLLARAVDKARQEIMAAEDKKVFEALDALSARCYDESHHPGVPDVALCDCPNEICWITDIMES